MATATLAKSTVKYGPTIQGDLFFEVSFSETESRLDIPFSGKIFAKIPPIGTGLTSFGSNPMMRANVTGVGKEVSLPVGHIRPSGKTTLALTIPISISLDAILPPKDAQAAWKPDYVLSFRLELDPEISAIRSTAGEVKLG